MASLTPRWKNWILLPLSLFHLAYNLIVVFIMSTLLRKFSRRNNHVSQPRPSLNGTDDNTTTRPKHNTLLEKILIDLDELLEQATLTLSDLPAFLDALKHCLDGVGINDRLLMLEKVITLMSKWAHTEVSHKVQEIAITMLFRDLPHPPNGYLSLPPLTFDVASTAQCRVNYAFRFADGSYNSVLYPTLGKAGSPYARSVHSLHLSPRSALPDPGLVFDTLLKRDKNKFVPHPGGVSSLFFAFADLVIHSIFNTNHSDPCINDASSYLDLSVLYGNNDAQVDSVRRKDGSGKLWDDVFADSRLLFMPPASCALLILMNRNHNFIAQRILDINENQNLKPLPIADKTQELQQDDEIFHRARLVNCGYFMNIILGDYVGAILGLVRDGSDWRFDPKMTIRDLNHEVVPVGQGNVVSTEFNLLYRWHSPLSKQDTEWTTKKFNEIFEGKDPAEITVQQFGEAAHKYMIPSKNVKKWTFGDIERDADGRFKDSDLANILHNATEARAGAFQARGIPEALRVIEIMGIQRSRTWGTCSLNEFRKFLGLKQYSTFKEWNPDTEIHTAAAALYKDINNLELYVGLQAEQTKKPGPGAGLCPGYTISRAILADAVCLTRGDRFMTVEFTPFNLTAWGYQDCQYDPKDGSFGGLLTKLLFRTLPDHYPTTSAFAHFPFLDPVFMKDHLIQKNPELAAKYSWLRPRSRPPTVPIDTFAGVTQVLTTPDFVSAYDERLFRAVEPVLTKKMHGGNLKSDEKSIKALSDAKNTLIHGTANVFKLVCSDWEPTLATYFSKKTEDLIKIKSFKHVGKAVKYVDIIRDVINLVPVHWISEEIVGLPLQTETNRHGDWDQQDTYEKFAGVARYVYLNTDPSNDWHLREAAQEYCTTIVDIIHRHVDGSKVFSLHDTLSHKRMANYDSHKTIKKLSQELGSRSPSMLAAQIFAAVVPSAALYSQAVSTVVDYYLRADRKAELGEIIKLVKSSEKNASDKVMSYVYEALRLNPPVGGVYRTATKDVTVGPVTIQASENVFASIAKANLDSSVFGVNAASADYSRPLSKPVMWFPEHGLLSTKFFETTVPVVLASIFTTKDIAIGPGQSGSLNRFSEDWNGTQTTQYVTTQGLVTPWPDSLIVQYSN